MELPTNPPLGPGDQWIGFNYYSRDQYGNYSFIPYGSQAVATAYDIGGSAYHITLEP